MKSPDFWRLKNQALKLDIGPEKVLIFDHEGAEK